MSENRSRGDACLEDRIEVVACEDAVCEDLHSPLLWESMKALIADPIPSLLVSTDSEPIKAALEYVAEFGISFSRDYQKRVVVIEVKGCVMSEARLEERKRSVDELAQLVKCQVWPSVVVESSASGKHVVQGHDMVAAVGDHWLLSSTRR